MNSPRSRAPRYHANCASLVSKKGNRLSIRTAQDNFQKIVTKAGPFSIEKVTPHSMRHAFATHASEFYN
ncbi:MAG: tyrosine-type recombinase/integrase [Deltaproteobacteria bacterium]|nr:tyrosine-type recombinase/integrase [Deltaproteobacteria bacterium]